MKDNKKYASFIPLSNRLYPLEPDELSVILGENFARKTPMNTDKVFLRPFRPNAAPVKIIQSLMTSTITQKLHS